MIEGRTSREERGQADASRKPAVGAAGPEDGGGAEEWGRLGQLEAAQHFWQTHAGNLERELRVRARVVRECVALGLRVRHLEEALQQANGRARAVEAALQQANGRAREVEAALRAVVMSRSWRLMAPYRTLRRAARILFKS